MQAFMGVVRLGARLADASDRHALIQAAGAWRHPVTVEESAHAIFVSASETPRSDYETRPSDGRLFAGAAFVHNPEDISAVLGQRAPTPHAALVREMFESRGDDGLAAVRGAFAFAHWDEHTRRLTLARDCGRGKTLYFYRTDDLVIFASHLPSLISHRDAPRELDERVIASFLAHDSRQHRRTFFRRIDRVPPRYTVTVSRDGMSSHPYWTPRIRDERLYRRDEDYVQRGRELLDQAVARAMSDDPKFAVMASGGLDSSAIVSTLARAGRAPIPCYTVVPAEGRAGADTRERYFDERPKTELLARRYPALRFEHLTGASLQSNLDVRQAGQVSDRARFERTATPHQGASRSRFGNQLRARIAADGFDVVLGGGGGNFGLTWHGADLLPYLARKGRLLALLGEARATARHKGSSSGRTLVREVLLPSLPFSARRWTRRKLSPDPFSLHGNTPLRRDVVAELDLEGAWEADGFDPDSAWPSSAPSERARWLFDHPLLLHDNCPASPVFQDVELRNPLADRDLLEFALNVPATLYRRDGVPRWFARQVLADRVPAEILGERRRGVQPWPWFESLSARRGEIAAEVERMENSIIASQLFDIPRLRRLVDDWPEDERAAEALGHAYMLSLEQAIHVFQFIRWAVSDNA